MRTSQRAVRVWLDGSRRSRSVHEVPSKKLWDREIDIQANSSNPAEVILPSAVPWVFSIRKTMPSAFRGQKGEIVKKKVLSEFQGTNPLKLNQTQSGGEGETTFKTITTA